MCSDVLHDIN